MMLYDQLDSLEVEEVWDRAGPTRHGYVDPSEAAYEMLAPIDDQPSLPDCRRYCFVL